MQQGSAPSGNSRGESILCLFRFLVTVSIPRFRATTLHPLPLWSHRLPLFRPCSPRKSHLYKNTHLYNRGRTHIKILNFIASSPPPPPPPCPGFHSQVFEIKANTYLRGGPLFKYLLFSVYALSQTC